MVVLLEKNKAKKYILLGCTFLLWCFFNTGITFAADVLVSPSSGSYSANQTFTATIIADPKTDSINAVEAELSFDTSALSVVSISKAGSAFSLWTTEPTFSNSAGTITFGGGSPSPFTARSTLITITFRATGEGSPTVSFTTASVLAADGKGTDVLEASPGAVYTITGATTPVTPETPTSDTTTVASVDDDIDAAIAFGDPPRAPEVGSSAFLDPELWYNTVDGLFTWELPFDVNVAAIEIATSSENEPTAIFDPPVAEFEVSRRNLTDGIQYLSIRFQNQVGWGAVTNRMVKIDTTPQKHLQFLYNRQIVKMVSRFLYLKLMMLYQGLHGTTFL